MFRSELDVAREAWFFYEPLTLLHPYESLQKQIVDAYTPYNYISERYSKITGRKVQAVTEEYFEEHPEVAEQNVALLKNSMELWKAASETSDAVAPMLYQYSWHCFISFFVYTFFRWEPQHCSSHGIYAILSDDIRDIKIRFLRRQDGLFQRLIDTWTLLGACLAFSPYLPVIIGNKIDFIPNDMYLLSQSNELSLNNLLTFSPVDYERGLYSSRREELLHCPFLINSIMEPTNTLKNYLIVFVASNLARYRPILWNSALFGKTIEQSNLILHSGRALLNYTLGEKIQGTGLLYQVSTLLQNIARKKFEFKDKEMKRI